MGKSHIVLCAVHNSKWDYNSIFIPRLLSPFACYLSSNSLNPKPLGRDRSTYCPQFFVCICCSGLLRRRRRNPDLLKYTQMCIQSRHGPVHGVAVTCAQIGCVFRLLLCLGYQRPYILIRIAFKTMWACMVQEKEEVLSIWSLYALLRRCVECTSVTGFGQGVTFLDPYF